MTATQLTVTTTAAAGTVLPAAGAVDSGNGNIFTNTGRELMIVNNVNAATLNVTITTNGVYSVGSVQYAIADLVGTVANGTSKVFGPFDKVLFNDANGNVDVAWSANTNITVNVISLGTA